MRVDICIPALNEERIIATSVADLKVALRIGAPDYTITVVDNGSTDDTAAQARDAGANVISLKQPGKGAAVIAASRASRGEIFGFIDADLSADPTDIPLLLTPIQSDNFDIAIGSRLINTDIVRRAFLRTLSSRIFNTVRSALLGISARDTQCGLKIMNSRGKAVLESCKETGWFFDMEFLARAERQGLRIIEIPVHWNEHRFPERISRLNMIRDGFGSLIAMVRIRRTLQNSAL